MASNTAAAAAHVVSKAATSTTAAARSATTFTAGPAAFQPRQSFNVSLDITRSYYLGHHHAALSRMRQTLSNVGLIIECRDFRVPISSWNPLLERSLAAGSSSGDRPRIIVYTKRDLVQLNSGSSDREAVKLLRDFHEKNGHAKAVVFLGHGSGSRDRDRDEQRSLYSGSNGDRMLLDAIKRVARDADSLTGLRSMVVGMPNAGKSTLLNRLRATGMGLPQAARTGAQPGVTRKLGTPVRIVPGESAESGVEGMGEGVFVIDTPGVFVPYVSQAEDMMKLALVGCVKDGLVPSVAVADYLLYHLNLVDPGLYTGANNSSKKFCPEPTNDVHHFLKGVAMRTGKLGKGGVPSLEAAADWVVQEWRRGELGRFALETVTLETLAGAVAASREQPLSMNQARKKEKEVRKVRNEAKRMGLTPPAAGGGAGTTGGTA
ncbi:mitochondrial GTPase [Diplogelasinospora grovesii]|uniref:Mitochondrial GTPase n=1 Tax=Diplogelasinospora grovesii TaxID=303347 RepID=A0AAN6NG95_9PEZI|nr:mitochondrial GTPase [Diplogelasinospora grovesii]